MSKLPEPLLAEILLAQGACCGNNCQNCPYQPKWQQGNTHVLKNDSLIKQSELSMYIFVGSTNPVKLNATRQAAMNTWPEVVVKGFEVESGISQQPLSDEETRLGAENRARKALSIGLNQLNKLSQSTTGSFTSGINQTVQDDTTIGVGLEGGVFEHKNGKLWNTVWVSIADNSGRIVSANGERFELPASLTNLIRNGKEMGPAMDELSGSSNIKQKEGMIGVITQKFIDRTEMYAGLAKLALGLWYGRDWEKELQNR